MLREDHFLLAINDIVKNGDNDTLPIDADIAFLRESREKLIKMALKFSASLERQDKRYALNIFNQIPDRKSTRLNSSHVKISYAVFCLKKKQAGPLHE